MEGSSEQTRTKVAKAAMLKALEEALGIVSTAVESVGITRQTHYNWLNSDPEYAAAVAEVREIRIDYVESKLLELIEKLDGPSIRYFLGTQAKSRGYKNPNRTIAEELVGEDAPDNIQEITYRVITSREELKKDNA